MDPSFDNSLGGFSGNPNFSSGAPVSGAPVASGSGDIILAPSEGKKGRKRLVIGLLAVALTLIFGGLGLYFLVLNPPEIFKSKLGEFVQQYDKITSFYSTVVDVENGYIEWEKISENYTENGLSYKGISELQKEINSINPMTLDGGLVGQAKDVVAKTTAIAEGMTGNLEFLKSLYDGYISYYLPYLTNSEYNGDLPTFDVVLLGIENNDLFDERLMGFGDFMEFYRSGMQAMNYNYKLLDCSEEKMTEECAGLKQNILSNFAALGLEWAQLEEEIFAHLNKIEKFSNSDIYGVLELKAMEEKINGQE